MSSSESTANRAPRFILLLVAILAELMLAPLFVGNEVGLHLAQGFTTFVLLAALWAADVHGASLALFVPTLVVQALAAYFGTFPLHVAALVFRVGFFSYATGLIIWRTLRRTEVTIDTIAGAACAYTLLGVIWAGLFRLLEALHPNSFQIPAAWLVGNPGASDAALVYFSFITLTTVGYGDITPIWPGAAGLAVAEAVVGQLYLAITIARLVSLHTARRD